MDIVFRKAGINDITILQNLVIETINNVCNAHYNKNQLVAWTKAVKDKHKWIELINKQYVVIAEVNYKVVGFASLLSGNYIDMFYVDKNFQRKGIATALFKIIKTKALDLNSKKLNADVSLTAKPFFINRGFKIIKEQQVIRNSITLINFKMEKELI